MMPPMQISVILPACNEEGCILTCLEALARQDFRGKAEVIVAANGCHDTTCDQAENMRPTLDAAGWELIVLDLAQAGKPAALNAAGSMARGEILVYLDADVICAPQMMTALWQALDGAKPLYASGHLAVAPARSRITRHVARVWQRLPFMTTNVQGAGLFAVNRTGRARWGDFPDIISDDGFVRLSFAPDERIRVAAVYHWPMAEGLTRLIRVRRRQDAGTKELRTIFPHMVTNESKPALRLRDHWQVMMQGPISYAVYVGFMLLVKAGRSPPGWARGR